MKEKKTFKLFLMAILTVLALMVMTYLLSLKLGDNPLPFYKFLLSPFLVLGSDSSSTIIAIIIFLIVIGGVCNTLENCGFMEYMLNKITKRYANNATSLMYVLVFFFMVLGSFVGSFEEVVPLVPLVVALALKLGFDEYTGVGMSLLAVGCGFAAGVANPFTIGVAQQLANLPMFSGISLRLFTFVLIYLLLTTYLRIKQKRKDKSKKIIINNDFVYDENKEKALKVFVCIMVIGLLIVISSSFITFLQDYTMIIIALMFLVSGVLASVISGLKGKGFFKTFIDGTIEIAPSILLILMASSVRYIMEETGMMNNLLNWALSYASNMNKSELILFVYLICLVMNLFIPSGSAKAFLLIPLIVPLANAFGLSAQLCILAFAFGDGFSNVLYPTNPALLISLGLIHMDYKAWFRWSIGFQLLNIILTSLILLLGLAIAY